jgi:hypothetical protein
VHLDELAVGVDRALRYAMAAARPVLITELVLRPNTSPTPPVARHTASPRKARISPFFRSCAMTPRHDPVVVEQRPVDMSQNSNFRTIFSPGMVTPRSS